MEEKLNDVLTNIKPVNRMFYQKCVEKWNAIAKPIHGLGKLEDIICQVGAVREDVTAPMDRKCAIIFCADNGVVKEGVSQTDESVTAVVAKNLANGISTVNIMGAQAGVTVIPVDIGMKTAVCHEKILDKCVRRGTDNIAEGPAMTRSECVRAVLCGVEMAEYAKNQGYDMIASGEMGIGNTTTSAAIASVLSGIPPKEAAGTGAGLSAEGLQQKIRTVERAVAVNRPDCHSPLDVLAKLGGFDIAGMTGLFLGGAYYGIPVVIDGVISLTAANLAKMMCKYSADYMIASHTSREPACTVLFRMLGKEPVIAADMALGEGTGAVSLFPLLDMAKRIYDRNITFDDIHMEAYQPFERGKRC